MSFKDEKAWAIQLFIMHLVKNVALNSKQMSPFHDKSNPYSNILIKLKNNNNNNTFKQKFVNDILFFQLSLILTSPLLFLNIWLFWYKQMVTDVPDTHWFSFLDRRQLTWKQSVLLQGSLCSSSRKMLKRMLGVYVIMLTMGHCALSSTLVCWSIFLVLCTQLSNLDDKPLLNSANLS